MSIDWEVAGLSDVGKVREGNEDSFRIDTENGIFIVADGMGGHAAGDVASRVAADSALEVLLGDATEDVAEALKAAFARARDAILRCCENDPSHAGMGTTLTVAVLDPAGNLQIGHIGDSRAYRFRSGELTQLTRDHTWVQREVEAGKIEPDDAHGHPLSHILTRVLTDDQPGKPDVIRTQVKAGDWLLLSTDGLHNLVRERKLARTLRAEESPATVVQALIDRANRKGGPDNITAIAVRIVDRAG